MNVSPLSGEEPIRRLRAGDYFGELALLGDRRRTATDRAVTDTSVLSIARRGSGSFFFDARVGTKRTH